LSFPNPEYNTSPLKLKVLNPVVKTAGFFSACSIILISPNPFLLFSPRPTLIDTASSSLIPVNIGFPSLKLKEIGGEDSSLIISNL